MFTPSMICIVALLVCSAGQSFAAPSDWAAVQSLSVGQNVQVRLTNGKTLRGRLDRVTTVTVILQALSQTTSVRRDEISRLYVERKRNWAKPVLIGAAVGAAAAGAAAPATMEHESGYAGAVAGTVAFGAMIGAGVGYLARGTGKLLVYAAPEQGR